MIPCLHCAIWAAIHDWVRQSGSIDPATGHALAPRGFTVTALAAVLADALASEPDKELRAAMATSLGAYFVEAAKAREAPRLGALQIVTFQ